MIAPQPIGVPSQRRDSQNVTREVRGAYMRCAFLALGGMHAARVFLFLYSACGVWGRRCPHISLSGQKEFVPDKCSAYLKSKNRENYYRDFNTLAMYERCDVDSVPQRCYCAPGRRALDASENKFGVYDTGQHLGSQCLGKCQEDYWAIHDDTQDPKSCACWARAGCTFTDRYPTHHANTVGKSIVLLVPDDLHEPVEEVACNTALPLTLGKSLLCDMMFGQLGAEKDAKACGNGTFWEHGACTPCTPCTHGEHTVRECEDGHDRVCVRTTSSPEKNDTRPACKRGEFFHELYGVCRRCSGGMHNTDGLKCQLCPVQTESARSPRADVCEPCPRGFVRNADASDGCSPCPAGEEYDEARKACKRCAGGFFKPHSFPHCLKCPDGKVSTDMRDRCVSCRQHLVTHNGQTECVECNAREKENAGVCEACHEPPRDTCNRDEFFDNCEHKDAWGHCKCACTICTEGDLHRDACNTCPYGMRRKQGTRDCQFDRTWLDLDDDTKKDMFPTKHGRNYEVCADFLAGQNVFSKLQKYKLQERRGSESKKLAALSLVLEFGNNIRRVLQDEALGEACHLSCQSDHVWHELGIGYVCLHKQPSTSNSSKCEVQMSHNELNDLNKALALIDRP